MQPSTTIDNSIFRDLFQNTQVSMIIFDQKQQILEVNDAFCKFCDFSRNDILGKPLENFIYDADKVAMSIFEEHFNKGVLMQVYDVRLIRKDSTYEWHRMKISTSADQKYIFAVFKHIDDLQRTMEVNAMQNQELDAIINSLPGLFYVSDLDGKILKYNDHCRNLFATGLNDADQVRSIDFVHKDDLDKVLKMRSEAIINGDSRGNLRIIDKDGNIKYYHISNKVFLFENEICTMGIGIDISDNHHLAFNLQERVKELKCINQISEIVNKPDFDPISDLEEIVDILPPAYFKPESTYVRIALNDYSISSKIFKQTSRKQVSSSPNSYGFKLKIEVFIDEDISFLEEEQTMLNTLCHNIVTGINRFYSKQELKRSEKNYRSLFDNSPAVIVIWDINDFKVKEVNKEACKLYGFSKKEFLSLSVFDYNPPEIQTKIREYAKSILTAKKKVSQYTLHHKNNHGDDFYLDISSLPIDYKGQSCILSLGKNITELVIQENNLKEYAQQIRKLNRRIETAREDERSRLSRDIHDVLQQELTVIKLYSGILSEELETGNSEIIKKRTDKIISMVDQSIETTRNIARNLRPQDSFNRGIYGAIEHQCREISNSSAVKVHFHGKEGNNQLLDAELTDNLYRIFQESISNILKHAKATEINVKLISDDDNISLTIVDNGIGFDVKDTRKNGLGLLGIKERVNLFDGVFKITSEKNKGTKSEIKLPIVKSLLENN